MCRKVIFYCLVLCVGTLGWLTSVSPAMAQQDESEVLRKMFGLGIHQYNAGNFVQAYDSFSTCIEAKSKNPSVYYFRGLCLMQLGRVEDAAEDFQAGAAIELSVTNSTALNQVGYDLQNVQGNLRLTLEQYRTEAKLRAYQNRQSVVALQQGATTVNAAGGPVANFQYEEAPGSYSIDGDTSLEDPLAEDTGDVSQESSLDDPLADDSVTEESDEGLDSVLDDSDATEDEAEEETLDDDSLEEEDALEDEAEEDLDEETTLEEDADEDTFGDEEVAEDEELTDEEDVAEDEEAMEDETVDEEELAEDEELTDEDEAVEEEEELTDEAVDEESADEEVTEEEDLADDEEELDEEVDEEEDSDELVAPEEEEEDVFDE